MAEDITLYLSTRYYGLDKDGPLLGSLPCILEIDNDWVHGRRHNSLATMGGRHVFNGNMVNKWCQA